MMDFVVDLAAFFLLSRTHLLPTATLVSAAATTPRSHLDALAGADAIVVGHQENSMAAADGEIR